AEDYDSRVPYSGLLGKLKHGSDGRTLADELRRGCRGEHSAQRGVLAAESAVLDGSEKRLFDQGGLHRFAQVVKCAELHGLDAVVVVRLTREDDNLAGQSRLGKPTKHCEAAHPGHAKVQKHDVERLLSDPVER